MNDAYLLRFCRGRQFRLEKVIEMFEKCLAWRAKWNADTILEGWVFPQEEAL